MRYERVVLSSFCSPYGVVTFQIHVTYMFEYKAVRFLGSSLGMVEEGVSERLQEAIELLGT